MITYNKLKKEFENKVKELQNNCQHKKTTWVKHCWAIGHSSGYKVKICDICNKSLEENPTKKEREKQRKEMIKQFMKENKK